jgi:rhodanese-related sulfurtransferase
MNKGFTYTAIGLIGFAVIIAILPDRPKEKQLSPLQLHAEMMDQTRFMSVEEVADAIIQKDPSLLLVDLRPESEYKLFSLPNAVNIPVDKLLLPDNHEILSDPNRKIVFFSNDGLKAELGWMIEKRINRSNIFEMKGGLNQWFRSFFFTVEPQASAPGEEWDLYKFRLAVKQFLTGGGEIPASKPKAIKKETVVVKPVQKAAAEGGC